MKILYLIQTPWSWILQRSQVIEMGIEEHYDCEVIDKKFYPSTQKIFNNTLPKKIKYIPQFRGAGKIELINKINRIIYKLIVKSRIEKSDAVWLCSPSFFEVIPTNYKGYVIYDCMDDYVALAAQQKKEFIYTMEKKLTDRADLLFASSAQLIANKPGFQKATLIRNGFVADKVYVPKCAEYKNKYKFGYFGTIGMWFDFETIINSTMRFKNIEYHLIGPVKIEKFDFGVYNNKEYLKQNRVYLDGLVKHEELYNSIVDFDVLIMPFIVNDVILSVDPVKLYEYISFGKCVISVWYPEIERFSPYVYFYRNRAEFNELISKLLYLGFPPKYNAEEQEKFLKANSWDMRCSQVNSELKKLNNK